MANQPTKYRKFVVGAASAALVASAVAPVASAKDFSDSKGNTHEAAIDALSDAGIISGYEDGTFKPNKTLTRSDVVKMMGKWLVSEGYEVPSDYKTNMRFSDLTASTNDELLRFAAVVKDNGVFNGSNGRLLAGDNMSRENMAVVLVRAFDTVNDINLVEYVEGQDFKKEVTDLNSAKSEARTAINVLDFFDVTTVAQFNPKDTTTRGHFATFLNNFLKADLSKVTGTVSGVAAVKAVNATTVEVTFTEDVKDVDSLKFAIEGLTVSNAVVKQSDAKTVILTTSAQEGGKKYEVTLSGNKLGSFEGISGVIPTKIEMNTTSTQGVVGKEVTLKADIGVKEAGVPVTFNVAAGSKLNKDHIEEVTTDAEGIATYSYTQYVAGASDDVVAYPTGAPAVRSLATVYWGVDNILTVKPTDEKQGNSVSNGVNKVYEVTYKDPKTGTALANQKLHVTFEENIDVTIDKASAATVNGISPRQLTNGSEPTTAVIVTDSNGKATFTVSGNNTAVTPVVFANEVANNKDVNTYEPTKLQAKADKVVFGAVQSDYVIDVVRADNAPEEAAIGLTNGREYKVTLKSKDGKEIANEVVNVAFNEDIDRNINTNTNAYFVTVDGDDRYKGKKTTTVKTNDKGEATFIIASDDNKDYATPIVWVDINTSNAKEGNLDEGEPSKVAPISYFATPKLTSGVLEATDVQGKKVKDNIFDGIDAVFTFNAANQSSKKYSLPSNDYSGVDASFTVENTGGEDVTVLANGRVIVVSPNRSTTVAVNGQVAPSITVQANKEATSVKVSATGTAVPHDATKNRPVVLGSKVVDAKFTSPDGIPAYMVNANVEWVNVSKNTMVLKGLVNTTLTTSKTIDYSKAEFYVADVILGNAPGTAQGSASSTNQTYTKVSRADFNRFVFSNSTVTFTKGADGAHVLRLVEVVAGGTQDGPAALTKETVNATNITQGSSVAKAAQAAAYESAAVSNANFSTGSFDIQVATGNVATVTINGTDNAETIKNKINSALTTDGVPATATVKGDRVVITATVSTSADKLTVSNSSVPAFGAAVVQPTPALTIQAGKADYVFTNDIVEGHKVVVNGIVYTASTSTTATTFDATQAGGIASDLANLALAINLNTSNTVVSATSASNKLTLTEKPGQYGVFNFGAIEVK